jgi:toxin YoeB
MRSISITKEALQHLDEWKLSNPKMLLKIIALLTEIAKTPFDGTGKPEPLKHQLKGKWSRRINQEHRIIYEVKEESVVIYSCRYHYE